MMSKYILADAQISLCGKYRYRLERQWAMRDAWGGNLSCVFIMLNPSTADGGNDDPTIRRCVGFAQAFGYRSLQVVNLFAYRATNPKELLSLSHNDNPVGFQNQEAVEDACNSQDCGMIIAAWGSHGGHMGQDETVLGWIRHNPLVRALGLTKEGHPRHPLYLMRNSTPFHFSGKVYTA
jgi:hypothetical protein